MSDKPTNDSPAMTLIRHVWDHNREATGHSWTRLNGSMHGAVALAIAAGLRFDRDDFTMIAALMRVGYWSGADGGEDWYRRAIELVHPSAYQSYEAWRARRPFIVDGERLHVGKQLRWTPRAKESDGWWTVTSFGDDQTYVTAVQYAPASDSGTYERTKVARRCKITRADIYERNARIKHLTAQAVERQKKVDELTEAASRGTTWFKVLMDGRSFHGGTMTWSLPKRNGRGEWVPGEWHTVPDRYGMGVPSLCECGLHLTKLPVQWWSEGAEVFEVEMPKGVRVEGNHEKAAVLKCRLVRKIEGDELRGLGISPSSRKAEVAA